MLHELLGPEWGRQQLATAGLWHSQPRSFWSQHCISSLTTRPHSSCFPARAHCRLKIFLFSFHPLPLVSILSSSFHFSSPFLCPSRFSFLLHLLFVSVSRVPLKPGRGTGNRRPLCLMGKAPFCFTSFYHKPGDICIMLATWLYWNLFCMNI